MIYMILYENAKIHEISWNSKKSMVCRRRRRNTNEFTVLYSVFRSPRTLNSMNFIQMEEYGVFSLNSSIFLKFHENPLFPLKSQECGEMGVLAPPCVDLLCLFALFDMFLRAPGPPKTENHQYFIFYGKLQYFHDFSIYFYILVYIYIQEMKGTSETCLSFI